MNVENVWSRRPKPLWNWTSTGSDEVDCSCAFHRIHRATIQQEVKNSHPQLVSAMAVWLTRSVVNILHNGDGSPRTAIRSEDGIPQGYSTSLGAVRCGGGGVGGWVGGGRGERVVVVGRGEEEEWRERREGGGGWLLFW